MRLAKPIIPTRAETVAINPVAIGGGREDAQRLGGRWGRIDQFATR